MGENSNKLVEAPKVNGSQPFTGAHGSVDLLPCPCCGGEEIELGYSPPPMRGGPPLWSLECLNPKCGLVLPAKLSEAEVSRAWNRRSPRNAEASNPGQ